MIAAKGDVVAYERQAGYPPVVAVVTAIHDDGDCTVQAVSLSDSSGRLIYDFTACSIRPEFRMPVNQVLAPPSRTALPPPPY